MKSYIGFPSLLLALLFFVAVFFWQLIRWLYARAKAKAVTTMKVVETDNVLKEFKTFEPRLQKRYELWRSVVNGGDLSFDAFYKYRMQDSHKYVEGNKTYRSTFIGVENPNNKFSGTVVVEYYLDQSDNSLHVLHIGAPWPPYKD